ncbi:MAG: trigger factor [Crocinitomicaceae bacterium]
MIVTRENVDALNATLKVQVKPEDYKDKVKAILEKQRKEAKIKGFRPGHVPMSLIEKQFGKSALADVLNNIVNDSLYNYINENKIEILGNPIPSETTEVQGDFNNPADFEFTYDIGLSPEVEVKVDGRSKYEYVKVKVDEELINKQIDDLRRRYGKLVAAENAEDKDLVLAQFVELNEDNSIKEGGIMHSSTISMEFIEDKKVKKELTGKKVGDKLTVDPLKVSRGGKDTAAMLGIKEEELANIGKNFQITINEIKRMELAELNQELFDRLFGADTVKTEEDLREKVKNDLSEMFVNDSDKLLTRSIFDDLLEKTKLELPNEFLKRWIRMSNEKPITPEQIDAEYDGYAQSLKWQLIQNTIFKKNDLKIEQEEVVSYTKELLKNNFAQYGMPTPEDKELTETAMGLLSKKEESNRIVEMLADKKLTDYFKNTVKLKEKELEYDKFVELASAK